MRPSLNRGMESFPPPSVASVEIKMIPSIMERCSQMSNKSNVSIVSRNSKGAFLTPQARVASGKTKEKKKAKAKSKKKNKEKKGRKGAKEGLNQSNLSTPGNKIRVVNRPSRFMGSDNFGDLSLRDHSAPAKIQRVPAAFSEDLLKTSFKKRETQKKPMDDPASCGSCPNYYDNLADSHDSIKQSEESAKETPALQKMPSFSKMLIQMKSLKQIGEKSLKENQPSIPKLNEIPNRIETLTKNEIFDMMNLIQASSSNETDFFRPQPNLAQKTSLKSQENLAIQSRLLSKESDKTIETAAPGSISRLLTSRRKQAKIATSSFSGTLSFQKNKRIKQQVYMILNDPGYSLESKLFFTFMIILATIDFGLQVFDSLDPENNRYWYSSNPLSSFLMV